MTHYELERLNFAQGVIVAIRQTNANVMHPL